MANDIGFSFAPGATSRIDLQNRGGRPGGLGLSPQQAVKLLSLRVPDRPSPTSVAPLPLLQSLGSAAPGAGGLDTLIAALMQAFRPQAGGRPTPTDPFRPIPSSPGGRVELPLFNGGSPMGFPGTPRSAPSAAPTAPEAAPGGMGASAPPPPRITVGTPLPPTVSPAPVPVEPPQGGLFSEMAQFDPPWDMQTLF